MNRNFAYVPVVPSGVTLFSIAVSAHNMSGNALKRATLQQYFGRPSVNITSLLGGCAYLAETTGMVENGERLLRETGLFTFYASAMTPSRERRWLSEIKKSALSGFSPQKFITGMAQQKLSKRVMHFCTQCIHEDASKYGFSHWHTVHQIPGVHHCPKHQEPLRGACLNCGLSQGSDHTWNLPALRCPYCGYADFAAPTVMPSPGYLKHLRLVAELCSGKSSVLRPERRGSIFRDAYGGSPAFCVPKIIEEMLADWNCLNLFELSTVLETKVTPAFIEKAVCSANIGVNPNLLLAVVAHASGALDKRSQRCVDVAQLRQSPTLSVAPWMKYLERAMEAEGLPATIADRLAAGYSLTRISADEGIPYPRLRRQLKMIFERDSPLCSTRSCTNDQLSNALVNLHGLRHKLLAPVRKSNVFERLTGKTFEEVRTLNREKVQRYLAQGVRTRKQLHYKNSDLGDWCRKFDSEWFSEVLPEIPQSERKGVGRKRTRNIRFA